MEKVIIPWADTKEDFIYTVSDGEWIITADNRLIYLSEGGDLAESDYNVKESFLVHGLAPHHTTDWLRFFCEEYHPEVNFDKEFETDKPGVFARYQERFDHDYEEWVTQEKYNNLKEQLAKRGYEFPWE